MRVDLYASKSHYLEHLAPVWAELAPEERGHVVIPEPLRAYAEQLLPDHDWSVPEGASDVRLAAGWVDVQGSPNGQRRALMEHGVGQRYEDVAAPNYVGGRGRTDVVDLFLLPNRASARYQDGDVAVVGDPFLDRLRESSLVPLWDVTFAFHFKTDLCPEASGYPEMFREGIVQCVDADLRVLGHGHPSSNVWGWYEARGITTTSSLQVALRTRCFAADNTSAMFYAAALGIPVVVLNPPYYRRSVEHGLRFWEFADVGLNVGQRDNLLDAVKRSIYDDPCAERRAQVVSELFPFTDGMSARRCVSALRDKFDS